MEAPEPAAVVGQVGQVELTEATAQVVLQEVVGPLEQMVRQVHRDWTEAREQVERVDHPVAQELMELQERQELTERVEVVALQGSMERVGQVVLMAHQELRERQVRMVVQDLAVRQERMAHRGHPEAAGRTGLLERVVQMEHPVLREPADHREHQVKRGVAVHLDQQVHMERVEHQAAQGQAVLHRQLHL